MYCSGNLDSLWFFADVGTKNVRRGRLSYPCRRCICCFGKCQQHNHSIGEVKIAITISIVFFFKITTYLIIRIMRNRHWEVEIFLSVVPSDYRQFLRRTDMSRSF